MNFVSSYRSSLVAWQLDHSGKNDRRKADTLFTVWEKFDWSIGTNKHIYLYIYIKMLNYAFNMNAFYFVGIIYCMENLETTYMCTFLQRHKCTWAKGKENINLSLENVKKQCCIYFVEVKCGRKSSSIFYFKYLV